MTPAQSSVLIAELAVRPNERIFSGPKGSTSVEPLVMALFLELSSRAGALVTRRELFDRLWGSVAVGDDNLNRLVALLRRTLNDLGVTSLRIETVPATGYFLRLEAGGRSQDVRQAISEARDSWKLGMPEPDLLRIALLERAGQMDTQDAEVFGLSALLHRHAAEYADPEQAASHVQSCDTAARRALEIDPEQVEALTALVSVAPLYGQWFDASRRLYELCANHPGHPVPENDLSIVEMATGQVLAAKRRRDRLLAADPLTAQFCYKSVYHHWSVEDHVGMDHLADSAMQLWPLHPAVWTVRFWTFAYTGRFGAAQAVLARRPPQIPEPMVAFLRRAATAAESGETAAHDEVAAQASSLVSKGPAHAIAALFALSLIGRTDDVFEVAKRYYLHDGQGPVPLQALAGSPKLNEQHRRLTQVLFTPVFAALRQDRRFEELCGGIGLTAFWEQSEITPDYQL